MILAYLSICLVALLLMSVYIISTLRDYFYSKERVAMFTKANVVANMVLEWNGTDLGFLSGATKDIFSDKPMRLIILDSQAIVTYDNDSANTLRGKIMMNDTIKSALLGQDSTGIYNKDSNNSMDVGIPIKKNSQITGAVYLSQSLSDADQFLGDITSSLITLSIVISALIVILSAIMSHIFTLPLLKLTNAADEIAQGNFNQTVPVHGHDEIAALGNSFNAMIKQLALIEEKRRTFVSDASHELKTPLATIKLLSESILQTQDPDPAMVREFLEDMSNEVDRLTRIVERLLALTKNDSQSSAAHLETVDLTKLISKIVKKLLPLAREKNIKLSFSYDNDKEHTQMLLDRDKIYEAIYNIADNSIKYTDEGGTVTITLNADITKTTIEIEDNGIGIPKEDAALIFDRFYRVDKARARETGGTGLGLAIAQEAVAMHGGHIEVISEEGAGSKFVIILPYSGK
mgnify:FL=1